jgi:hypothetical protein
LIKIAKKIIRVLKKIAEEIDRSCVGTTACFFPVFGEVRVLQNIIYLEEKERERVRYGSRER